MFGLNKKESPSDKLTVRVRVVASKETFGLAQKIWDENIRTLHVDQVARKEFLHFGYAQPKCVVWLMRDQNRSNPFELIVRWEEDKTHEVCIISNTGGETSGDDTRAKAILTSMLTTPSVVLSNQ